MITAAVALGVGALTGAVAGLVIRGRANGLLIDVLLGIFGSLLGAAVLSIMGLNITTGEAAGVAPAIAGAFVGATLLTSLLHALPRTTA